MIKRLAAIGVFAAIAGVFGLGANNVFDVSVGQCFNDPDEYSEFVANLDMVDCTEPHDNEIYHTFDVAGDVYPSDSDMDFQAESGCIAAFEEFVGRDYWSSSLNIAWLSPSEDSWNQIDDREIVCFLYDMNLAVLTNSAEGTGI